jgi:ribosome-associated toxin RatA of RatAB toxin-antitoxin module
MRRLAPVLAAFLATPALAFDVPEKAEAALGQGKPYVSVTEADGGASLIQAAIDIPAPVEVIWATVTDCERAPEMSPNLKSCRVVQRDPAGGWEVREQITKPGLIPSLRNVMRAEYDRPRSIRFRRVDGDLRRLDGEWRLTPKPGGIVRVTYEARMAAPFRIPAPLARLALRREAPTSMLTLRRESLARAK